MFHHLTYLEQLNVIVDQRAKRLLRSYDDRIQNQVPTGLETWKIWIHGKPIVSQLQSELYKNIMYERIKDYYIKHGDLTTDTMN